MNWSLNSLTYMRLIYTQRSNINSRHKRKIRFCDWRTFTLQSSRPWVYHVSSLTLLLNWSTRSVQGVLFVVGDWCGPALVKSPKLPYIYSWNVFNCVMTVAKIVSMQNGLYRVHKILPANCFWKRVRLEIKPTADLEVHPPEYDNV